MVLNGAEDEALLKSLRPGEALPQRLDSVPPRPAPNVVIAADGAARHLRNCALSADLLVGDMDSASLEDIQVQRQRGARIVHQPDQESSDVEKCFAEAYELGAEYVDLICWRGDRLDHILCLFSGLCQDDGLKVRLASTRNSVWRLPAGRHVFRGMPGDIVGLMHFNARLPLLSITGLAYEADKLELPLGCQAGANRITNETFVVEIDHGPVFLTHMDSTAL